MEQQNINETTQSEQKELHLDKSKNDTFAWLMAFVPLIGTIIGIIIGFGYTCLILNIILCYIDEKNLKEQGVDTSEFGELTFLVPYYLYKRAKALNDSMTYFAVWCVLFAITFIF